MKESDFSSRKEYWQALVAEQKRSGLSQVEFCKARGVSISSFYTWSSRFKRKAVARPTKEGSLLRIEVEKEQVPLKIVFQSGAAVHFTKAPDPEFLKLLLELVS